MDFSLSDQPKTDSRHVRQFMENEVRPGVRQRDREARFPSGDQENCRAGLLWHDHPEEWAAAGSTRFRFVLMMEEVARVDAAMGHFPQRGQFRGTAASVAVWQRCAEEKVFDPHGGGRNSRGVLPDRAASRIRRRGNSDPCSEVRVQLSAQWDEDLGHKR